MRKVCLFVLFLCSLAGAEAWTVFTPDDGSFKAQFPAPPEASSQKTKSAIGDIESVTWTVARGEQTFSVTATLLPRLATVFRGADGIYEDAQGDLLTHTTGRKLSWEDSEVGGHPGKSLAYRMDSSDSQGLEGRARFVLVENRLFVLNATGSAADESSFHQFFESFTAVPPSVSASAR